MDTNIRGTKTKGKIILVDPNKVNDGIGGSLKPEDMFIYVDLEVDKKPRTIIAAGDNGGVFNNFEGPTHINFISGSKEPGRDCETLTTNYTRLTTVLVDKNNQPDSESFGITDINIEFNSAFAPQITINFVDVRGSTLFEKGNDSKYNIFFDLPYPLFKLHVKGYFGPTVTYCLHLLKFTSRFNSSTGNFEVKCDFIGYTFAFLSDMIVGYLRAVTEIPRGREIFENEYKAKNPELVTINELVILLTEGRSRLAKVAATNKDNKALESARKILDEYKEYNEILDEFIVALKFDKEFVSNSKESIDGKKRNTDMFLYESAPESDATEIIDSYLARLDSQAANSNDKVIVDKEYQLPEKSIEKIFIHRTFNFLTYEKNNIPELSEEQKNRLETLKNARIKKEIKQAEAAIEAGNTENVSKTEYILADFKQLRDEINTKTDIVKKKIEELSVRMSKVVDTTMQSIIGFKPTIKNFIEIFTVHAEIFLKLIQETSIKAMKSEFRTVELDTLSNDTLNIRPEDQKTKTYYPWPEYNEDGIEQWIGKNIAPIPETILVEEFLEGLLKTQQADNAFKRLLDEGLPAYNPSNAFDLTLYKSRAPYDELLQDSSFFRGELDKIWLGLAMRMFNFAHCNHSISLGYRPDRVDLYNITGKFEALHLIESLEKFDYDKKIINQLTSFEGGDVQKQVDAVISKWLNGSPYYRLPNGQTKIMEGKEIDWSTGDTSNKGEVYRYIYLSDISNDDPELCRIYLPNFMDMSKLKRFYSEDGTMLGYTELKNEFLNDNKIYWQYSGFGYKNYVNNQTYERHVDDGSKYYDLVDVDYFNLKFNFPTEDNLASFKEEDEEKLKTKDDSDFKDLAETSSNYTNEAGSRVFAPPKFPGIGNRYYEYTKSQYTSNIRAYIYSAPFRVNDATRVELIKDIKHENLYSGDVISSAVFFYKDAYDASKYETVLNHGIWFASCPIPIGGHYTQQGDDSNVNQVSYLDVTEPAYFLGSQVNSDAFSPLCYPLTDVPSNLTSYSPPAGVTFETSVEENTTGYVAYENIYDITAVNNYSGSQYTWSSSNLEEEVGNQLSTGTYAVNATDVWTGDVNRLDITYTIETNTQATIEAMFFKHAESFSNIAKYNNVEGEQAYRERFNYPDDVPINWNTFDTKELIGRNRIAIRNAMHNVKQTFKDFSISFPTAFTIGANKVQLFGSELYFEQGRNNDYQDAVRARAFLFLRCLPLIGNYNNKEREFGERLINGNVLNAEGYSESHTNTNVIRDNMLRIPGLQEVPYAWILALGATYWRRETTTGEVFLTDEDGHPVIAGLYKDNLPTKETFWLAEIDNNVVATVPCEDSGAGYGFTDEDNSIINVPKEFKDMCREEFELWTALSNNGPNSWNTLRKTFEILDFDNLGDFTTAKQEWINVWTNFKYAGSYIDTHFKNRTENGDYKYITFQPYIANSDDWKRIKIDQGGALTTGPDSDTVGENSYGPAPYRWDYVLMINHKNEEINEVLLNFMAKTKVLVKRIGISNDFHIIPQIFVSEAKNYLTGFFTELNEQLKNAEVIKSNEDELKEEIFATLDNDLIRLNIYRQLSAIYTKWIGGSQYNVSVPCISDQNYDGKKLKLIDRFKFIDRAYEDIGDKLVINPFQIVDYLVGQLNQSFYDLVGSKILADNNLDFIALPTFIDFRTVSNVESMFRTYTYNDKGGLDVISGPSFVCIYVGQTSQFLDLGNKADYINDGVDFTDGCTGNKISDNLPVDMRDSSGKPIPVFLVNYADQNQSIFKDVKLDQSEFSETDESLQIIDNMSNSLKSFVGQNLYNVYSIRSYSTEIEMLGNLTIQPYMYFQLNGIPMFHGGYMIIKVSHRIEPHYAQTRFKGVRIKRVRTPLIDEDFIYLNILNTYNSDSIEPTSINDTLPVPEYNHDDSKNVIVTETADGTNKIAFSPQNFELEQLSPYFNNSSSFNYKKVDTIVVHCTDGTTLDGAIKTLYGKGYGYHFLIDRNGENDGKVIQGCPIDRRVAHAGESYGPQGMDANTWSIGISFVLRQSGGAKQKPTPKQWAAFKALVKELVEYRKADKDLDDFKWITFHSYISIGYRYDIYYLKDEVSKIATDNGLKLWLPGMPPFPEGLKNCECAVYETVDGVKWCKKVKKGNLCIGQGGHMYKPDDMVLPDGTKLGDSVVIQEENDEIVDSSDLSSSPPDTTPKE